MEEIIEFMDEVVEETFELPPEPPIKVYVKVNTNKEIIQVGSSIFLDDLTDWIEIGEGFGDKFAHAQSQYFDKPLMNEDGTYNYEFTNATIKEKV